MRPVEAFQLGGVNIGLGVGMFVMVPVMGGPPESALLGRGAAEKREEKLKGTAGFVAAVGEIAMEGPGNPEFPGKEHEGAKRHGTPRDPGPKHGQARQVDKDEEDAGKGYIQASMHKF
jgi:hypothetical protein